MHTKKEKICLINLLSNSQNDRAPAIRDVRIRTGIFFEFRIVRTVRELVSNAYNTRISFRERCVKVVNPRVDWREATEQIVTDRKKFV